MIQYLILEGSEIIELENKYKNLGNKFFTSSPVYKILFILGLDNWKDTRFVINENDDINWIPERVYCLGVENDEYCGVLCWDLTLKEKIRKEQLTENIKYFIKSIKSYEKTDIIKYNLESLKLGIVDNNLKLKAEIESNIDKDYSNEILIEIINRREI